MAVNRKGLTMKDRQADNFSDAEHNLLSIADMVKVEMPDENDSNSSPSATGDEPLDFSDTFSPDTRINGEFDVTDVIISEVGKHPPLYDRLLPLSARTISIRIQRWEEVRANVPGNMSASEVKNIWNTVRHRFMHERRLTEQGTKYATKYKYYQKMASILEPILEPTPNTIISQTSTILTPTPTVILPPTPTPIVQQNQSNKMPKKLRNNKLISQRSQKSFLKRDLPSLHVDHVSPRLWMSKKHTADTTSTKMFYPPTSPTSSNMLNATIGSNSCVKVEKAKKYHNGMDTATAAFFMERLKALKPMYARKMERKILKNLHKYEAMQEQELENSKYLQE